MPFGGVDALSGLHTAVLFWVRAFLCAKVGHVHSPLKYTCPKWQFMQCALSPCRNVEIGRTMG